MKQLMGIIVLVVISNFILMSFSYAQETSNNNIHNNDKEIQTLDLQLSELIKRHKLTGKPIASTSIPDINSP